MTSQMTPHMAQAGPSAGQMLAQMSRQNGVTHSVTPSHPGTPASTVAPLQGGPAGGGWPAAGAAARPQFNNQVTLCHEINLLLLIYSSLSSTFSPHLNMQALKKKKDFLFYPAGASTGCENHVPTICPHGWIWRRLLKLLRPDAYRCLPHDHQRRQLSAHECARQPQHQRLW